MSVMLRDVSHWVRTGVCGAAPERWLSENGYSIDDEVNRAYPQFDDSRIVRLSETELIWLGTERHTLKDVETAVEDHSCFFPSRIDSHAWHRIGGPQSIDLFATLCGVRLADLENHQVAQTSVARVSSIVVRNDDPQPVFDLLTDASYADYLWGVLADAATGFDSQIEQRQR